MLTHSIARFSGACCSGARWLVGGSLGALLLATAAGAAAPTITEYPAGSLPWGIAPGPDGNLWFTDACCGGVGKITPVGVVTEYRAGISAGSSPSRIAAGPDGNLWFTEYD